MGDLKWLAALLCCLVGLGFRTPVLRGQPAPVITPINLSNPSSGGQHPVMELDANGNVNIAWLMNGVYFRRSTNAGVSFSTATAVQLNSNPIGLQMALDAAGNINLLWYTPPDINSNVISVFFSRSTNGGATFSTPLDLGTLVGIQSELLQLLLDSHGNIDIVWSDTVQPGLFFTRSVDAGANFSSAVKFFTAMGDIINLNAVAGTQGQLYVFWSNEIGSACSILFSRATNGSSFSAAATISPGASACNSDPESVVDAQGNVDVSWISGNSVVFSRSVNQGASFSSPTNVSGGVLAFSTADEKLAVGIGGRISVVWTATLTDLTVLFATSDDDGATFSAPGIFSLPPGANMTGGGDPVIAVGAANQISVAWDDDSLGSFSGDSDIFLKTSANGGALFSNATDVSNAGATSQTLPEVIVDVHGNSYIVWTSQPRGASPAVFFAKLAAVATPVDQVRLRVGSPARSVPQGDVLSFVVDVSEIRGRGEAVHLSCADLPASMTCTFHPPSITPRLLGATSSLTVNVPPTLPLSTYIFAVNGEGARSLDTQTVELTVTAPATPASVSVPRSTPDCASQQASLAALRIGDETREESLGGHTVLASPNEAEQAAGPLCSEPPATALR